MNHDFINRCVKLSELHISRFLKRAQKDCGDFERNPFDSLRFFLREYAFERQGRSRDFAAVANEVILEAPKEEKDFSSLKAKKIWNTFTKKLSEVSVKPNYARNPLCPKGTKYTNNKGNTKIVNQKCVIDLVQEELGNVSIVSFARKKLNSDQELEEAYEILNKINGVGPKIASLFLRDVAVMYDCKKISNNKKLLQPIDTWIRYCVQICAGNTKLTGGCADFLIKATDEPEKANQGIWYFCSQVAQSSRYKVKRSIENPKYRELLIKKHLEDLGDDGETGKSFGG